MQFLEDLERPSGLGEGGDVIERDYTCVAAVPYNLGQSQVAANIGDAQEIAGAETMGHQFRFGHEISQGRVWLTQGERFPLKPSEAVDS
jgi:hypothetical protein